MNEPVNLASTAIGQMSTRRKWMVVLLFFVAILINFIDRSNLSVAAVPMMKDLKVSPVMMGVLLSAFFWTYSVMQIPAGYLVDRFQLKWIYGGAFLLWSLTSASVGIAQTFRQVFVLRLVLGVAESVAQPASIGFIQRHFCNAKQGLPTSIYLTGTQIGPALGASIGAMLLQQNGWRYMFVVTGLGACVWAVPWFASVPSERSRHSSVRSIGREVRIRFWMSTLTTPLISGVLTGAFFYSYFWYFCLTWLPSYLVMQRGFSFLEMGGFTATPLVGMAMASIISGGFADGIITRTDRPLFVRKLFVIGGFVVGSSILALPLFASSSAIMMILVMSLLGIGVASANYWAITQIISPELMIGRAIGAQNMVANVAGICTSLITGFLVGRTKNFDLAIVLAGLSLLLAAASFTFLVRERDAQELHQYFNKAQLNERL